MIIAKKVAAQKGIDQEGYRVTRCNETADWWPFSTPGMSTFLLLKIAMKKCLWDPS
ncbi:unnamed protein product [Porites evermanni]|uniref:Uncharacterized protein n=1 Tax=Porites evermanni TaxID=104178 RepID=A0ABN8T0P0_9CNID|nr:unnamed protein product [Porites evermanni]